MRSLSTPYFNHPVPARLRDNPEIYAPETFATSEYNERYGAAVATIVARGVGQGAEAALLKEIVQRFSKNRPAVRCGIELLEQAYLHGGDAERKEIEKAVAESADGDTVAAHIAFGSDYLCTEDQGKTAGRLSIFDADNRSWLKAVHGVNFINMQELALLLSR